MTEETKKKIAIVVIHGIGEQQHFETMGKFVKEFRAAYEECTKKKIDLKHNIVLLNDQPDDEKRTDSCISLKSDTEPASFPQVDVFEYYWSHLTQRKISSEQITDWLFKTAKGAKLHYKAHRSRYSKKINIFNYNGELKRLTYIAHILGIPRGLKYFFIVPYSLIEKAPFTWIKVFFRWLLKLVEKIPVIGISKNFLELIWSCLKAPFSRWIINYIGDIALYCSSDMKSEYYEVRKKILDGAVDKIKSIAMNKNYDGILICGHSLGSVIAYDAINRINILMQVDGELGKNEIQKKFIGMVTFGSPLDKTAFFFNEHIQCQEQPVRCAIATQLHGFRRNSKDECTPLSQREQSRFHILLNSTRSYLSKPRYNNEFKDDSLDPEDIHNGLDKHLSDMHWLNFWMSTDKISGPLELYEDLANVQMEIDPSGSLNKSFVCKNILRPKKTKSVIKWAMLIMRLIRSHNSYWVSPAMNNAIVRIFILAKNDDEQKTLIDEYRKHIMPFTEDAENISACS
jgi:hypothetical protein